VASAYTAVGVTEVTARLRNVWEGAQPASIRRLQTIKVDLPGAGPNELEPPKAEAAQYPPPHSGPRYQRESELRDVSWQKNWLVAMTGAFLKDIRNMDRKLQGRVLQAISELCVNPASVRGDTIKPLSQDLRGLWRYRLGDYRLIYVPVHDSRQVILVTFEARGSAY
jgi:mRNA-degrading endonuclease RelE of RelBE toxin-antitoxin system